ncbi:hypothetical protein BaRGS_00014795 [Batillaria attramentaria]|uniref:Uncharacterized protein n=1 Tax=Batillaria attramentaria TaxID=370345 RepID=A0ABD0L303_9CAEN
MSPETDRAYCGMAAEQANTTGFHSKYGTSPYNSDHCRCRALRTTPTFPSVDPPPSSGRCARLSAYCPLPGSSSPSSGISPLFLLAPARPPRSAGHCGC